MLRKAPIYKLKHPKHSKFAITDMWQKQVDFFLLYSTGADFSFRNNFANLGSFGKVSVPVQLIIPCIIIPALFV